MIQLEKNTATAKSRFAHTHDVAHYAAASDGGSGSDKYAPEKRRYRLLRWLRHELGSAREPGAYE
jgi:hypothetical protein